MSACRIALKLHRHTPHREPTIATPSCASSGHLHRVPQQLCAFVLGRLCPPSPSSSNGASERPWSGSAFSAACRTRRIPRRSPIAEMISKWLDSEEAARCWPCLLATAETLLHVPHCGPQADLQHVSTSPIGIGTAFRAEPWRSGMAEGHVGVKIGTEGPDRCEMVPPPCADFDENVSCASQSLKIQSSWIPEPPTSGNSQA